MAYFEYGHPLPLKVEQIAFCFFKDSKRQRSRPWAEIIDTLLKHTSHPQVYRNELKIWFLEKGALLRLNDRTSPNMMRERENPKFLVRFGINPKVHQPGNQYNSLCFFKYSIAADREARRPLFRDAAGYILAMHQGMDHPFAAPPLSIHVQQIKKINTKSGSTRFR